MSFSQSTVGMVSATFFLQKGYTVMGWRSGSLLNLHSSVIACRQFCSAFGCTPLICKHLWEKIALTNFLHMHQSALPKHLLYALIFLKQYNSKLVNVAITRADKKLSVSGAGCLITSS